MSSPPYRQREPAREPGRAGASRNSPDPRDGGRPRRSGSGAPPPTVHQGSRRGLSALGTGLLVVVLGGLGALVDVVAFGDLGILFGLLFVTSCVIAALRVYVYNLIDVVIMPPLAYAAITIAVGVFRPSGESSGAGLRNKAIDVGSEMILRAPVLLIAFGAVVVIAAVRARRAKVARRERERAYSQAANRRRPTR